MSGPFRSSDSRPGVPGSYPGPGVGPAAGGEPARARDGRAGEWLSPPGRSAAGRLGGLGRVGAATLRRRGLRWIPVALLLLLVAAGWALGTGYSYRRWEGGGTPPAQLPPDAAALKKLVGQLQNERTQLLAALRKQVPRGLYVVIDQTHNRFYLKRDETVEFDAVCSAGSGYVLKESAGDRKWVFDTPRGLFSIHNRIDDPAWRKPDWAFIEEGKPIPKNPAERVEYGTMGEYAFDLGHSYFIHGTLYERLLGRSVTHGCIRLGREDLRKVAQLVTIGTPVYIY